MADSLNPEESAVVVLARDLITLRGETMGRISQETEIRIPNLSVWLREKPQVISAERQAKILYYLGVKDGELRRDMLHLWHDQGSLEPLKRVFGTLLSVEQREVLRIHAAAKGGPTPSYILETGEILVNLTITPGLKSALSVQDALGYGTEEVLDTPMNEVFFDNDRWMSLLRPSFPMVGEKTLDLLEFALRQMGKQCTGNTHLTTDPSWRPVAEALMKQFQEGMDPQALLDWLNRRGDGSIDDVFDLDCAF
jgi:hypothetical protein